MKKLSKINISAEKVLGNEELVNLRGGSYEGQCDPQAGLMCSGSCTTPIGTSGTCKNEYFWELGKFLCTCVE